MTLMDSVKEIVVKAFQIREICGRCYQVIASPKKNKIKKSASSYNIALVREMPKWLFYSSRSTRLEQCIKLHAKSVQYI